MIFEELLILCALLLIIFLIGIPIFKFCKSILPQKQDPVKEAKVRLEVAKQELEVSKIMKQTEEIYSELYKDVLEDDEKNER